MRNSTLRKIEDDGSEGLWIRFLLLINGFVSTASGSVRAIDFLADSDAEAYWSRKWDSLPAGDVVWMIQACQIPVGERVTFAWHDTSEAAKVRIRQKSKFMAKRARELLNKNNRKIEHG